MIEMTQEDVLSVLEEEEALLADGFDDALVGYVQIFNKTVALYDRAKCIEILMRDSDMDHEGAEEFFEYNVVGAYMGEGTPGFATLVSK